MSDNFHDNSYRAGMTSGFGSAVQATTAYRDLLETFIRLNNVKTVLDLACGDWQFSRYFPWDIYGVSYLGLDVSEYIIEVNTAAYTSDNCKFDVIRDPSELYSKGQFDLVLCKDALQHMPNDTINQYLDAFYEIGRHSLVTNDIYPPLVALNQDVHDGGWRPIDLKQPPFSRKSFVVAEYHNYDGHGVFIKQAHLMNGRHG